MKISYYPICIVDCWICDKVYYPENDTNLEIVNELLSLGYTDVFGEADDDGVLSAICPVCTTKNRLLEVVKIINA